MKADYRISKTPDHLTKMGTAPFYITSIVGGDTNWDYERRAKLFHETEAEAHKAGKRYLRKMKQYGFDI